MSITTRAAAPVDTGACARVLAEAFAEDPVMSAIWPDPRKRHRALPRYFAASLRHFHIPGGGVQVATDPDGHLGGVAVWDPPGQWDQPFSRTLRAVPELLPALGRRTRAAIAVRTTLDAHHPASPMHWYLANIGTSETHRGQGYAARLLSDRLAQSPDTAAYLVCTREKNITFYEHFGFEITDTFSLPVGDRPLMWAMTYPAETA
ncbi:GNAT family N-acetyltransferase [Nocardia brasiliensis]|uniref:GNAT family N-acetyltransferase n=2 Tax=Nocardia brasiliensis TaxID=37326 RepID=UPI002B4B38F1|nr:GNAT family N-acetyltransferase [Nocardia brasiliensis]